jgi:hypothetical protein
MGIGNIEKGKLGELHVFMKLIERGAMPFLPICDITGIDAVVRKKDGTYVEVQVKTTVKPSQRGWFNVPGLIPRENLFIVGIEVSEEGYGVWIFPSQVFADHTTKRRQLGLNSGTRTGQPLREKLAEYYEAWSLLTG